jgi:hypothetical protein
MTILTALLSDRIPAWRLIGLGLVVEAVGLLHTTLISGEIGFWTIAVDRVWLVAGLPLILVPLTTGAYSRLATDVTGAASAFLNLFRNIGGAAGISIAQTILARRTPLHAARNALPVPRAHGLRDDGVEHQEHADSRDGQHHPVDVPERDGSDRRGRHAAHHGGVHHAHGHDADLGEHDRRCEAQHLAQLASRGPKLGERNHRRPDGTRVAALTPIRSSPAASS